MKSSLVYFSLQTHMLTLQCYNAVTVYLYDKPVKILLSWLREVYHIKSCVMNKFVTIKIPIYTDTMRLEISMCLSL